MARPKVPDDKRRAPIMQIRVSPEEKTLIEDAAKPQPVSTWARDELIKAAHRKKRKPD